MSPELEELLCQRHPQIFPFSQGVTTSKASAFACGDGWFDLVDTLCQELQHCTDRNNAPQLVAAQVKQKWGQLCFYPRNKVSPSQWGMIALAEAMSARICEECGKPGRKVVHGFYHTVRCIEHMPRSSDEPGHV